ncbi:MAG: hypothetical protein VR74_13065 [Hyphomonas sp. BRH_c22]|uniref:DUF2244 domain-containing protein n=1 Tax=Hyphomonas sp. BRH_c22 TaxID=1629710 RepID=UPI0005F13479|nr:DUF2244 domain-containing protein [Hyphomonas sp. BRH_c22]KJS36422.1 MAG: hypothetical protein VR74_13065 [Hyphomonas sp. BRH_c22]
MSEVQETIYFDAVLTPNRSLSPHGFAIVMAVVGIVSFFYGVAFVSIGAFPILGFFGLDALAIYLAFRWSFRQQREETRVTVTGKSLVLHHRKSDGTKRTVELPAAFARVELDEPLTTTSWLRIEHGRTAYVIGRFLTPPERKSLATALRLAILNARAERHLA